MSLIGDFLSMPSAVFCSVCESPDREKIDAALRGGTSLRGIGKTFGIGRTAITGHAAKHTTAIETRAFREAARGRIRKPKAVTQSVKPIESPEDVVADLQWLRTEALGLYAQAKARHDWKSAERIFVQVVSVVDRFAEMHRVLGGKGVSVTVDRSTQQISILASLTDGQLDALLARSAAGETIALPTILEGEVVDA